MTRTTIRDLFDRGTVAALGDGDLLARFADRRDEAAFDALVARHGPMVWATTLAVLRNEPDAEDAFQATFLTLAQRAESIRAGATLAAWLHRVAHRSAVKAGMADRRRRRLEAEGASIRQGRPLAEADLLAAVRTEVERPPSPYRLAVILCDLEGHTYAEAAARLGCTEAALRNRLARARSRLKSGLEHAGFGGSPLTLAPLQTTVPGSLLRSASALALGRTTASASVLTLVHSLSQGMLMSKLKLAGIVLLASGLASLGVIAVAQNPVPRPTPNPPPASAPVVEGPVIRGRVLDPSGQPVAGARVTLPSPRLRYNDPMPTTDSRADGRFEFALPEKLRNAILKFKDATLTAAAPGFGVGGTPGIDGVAEIEIRLVAEGPPLEGRILDEGGNPVVGAKVTTEGVYAPRLGPDGLDRILQERSNKVLWAEASYFSASLTATTGADGRFSMPGVGADRIASLTISGPTIAQTKAQAMTRGGPSVTFEGRDPQTGELSSTILTSRFDLAVSTTRILEGVVRDAESGQPLAGWLVVGSAAPKGKYSATQIRAWTDADGRYRLIGLPPFESFEAEFTPPRDQPFLSSKFNKYANPGPEPVTHDWSPRRGVFLSGRAFDKVTHQPLAGWVETLPFPVNIRGTNSTAHERTESAEALTDNQGRYRIAVPLGKSVLAFRAFQGDGYRMAQGAEKLPLYEPKTRQISQAITSIIATNYHILQEVNVEPNARDATMDLQVDPEGTIELTILDPEGNPLEGTDVQGVGEVVTPWPKRQESSKVALTGFTPNGVRQIIVVHKERKLAGVMIVDASKGSAQSIKLLSSGEVRGRVVAPDGTPRANAQFMAGPHFSKKPRVLPFDILPNLSFGNVGTDAEGRFHVDGLVPRMHYGASVGDRQFGLFGDLFDDLTVEPGEAKDLGDVKVEKSNPFYRGPK